MVATSQLRARGWSRHRIASQVRLGRWTRVAPSVVALQTGPLSRDQLCWLGTLHAGPTSALTHLTACERAGLIWTSDPVVHVITEKGDLVEPLPGLRFHQTRRPYLRWLHPTAQPRRLDVEHAALLTAERDRSLRRGIGLLAAHVQQGLTTAERLGRAGQHIRKLRHGAHLRLALGDIAGGAQSFAEIDIGRLCAEAGLPAPDRQRIRLDKHGRRRCLDCEWILPDDRIVVLEIDGSFHMRTDRWWRDMKRERGVVVSGRIVLRCSSIEIRLEPHEIIGVPCRFVCDRPA